MAKPEVVDVSMLESQNMERPKWPVPDFADLEEELRQADHNSQQERASRLRFIKEEFGPPVDMLLVGGLPSMFAIQEMKHSFVVGNFMAKVLLAQAFVEHFLGGSFILGGDDSTATSGFARLVDQSLSRGELSIELAERLHELRRMRNPYSHPSPGMTPRSYMGRLVEKNIYDPEKLAEQDARFALQVVVDFLRNGSPDWRPK
jgi:hypothetical protein